MGDELCGESGGHTETWAESWKAVRGFGWYTPLLNAVKSPVVDYVTAVLSTSEDCEIFRH